MGCCCVEGFLFSKKFNIKSSVSQGGGGICSFWMFIVYINDLTLALKSNRLGCRIRNVFALCVLHADDILLVSGSLIKLQIMMNMCNDFAYLIDLTLNNKKSVCFAIFMLNKCQFFGIRQLRFCICKEYFAWFHDVASRSASFNCIVNCYCFTKLYLATEMF